jgi:hypothetical protein
VIPDAIILHRSGEGEIEVMANMDVRTWGDSEILPRSAPSTAAESGDDGFDFPPTAHPVRELITASLFGLGVIGLIVWCGSKLL